MTYNILGGRLTLGIVLPKNPNFNKNIGEKKVYDFLTQNIDEDIVCYYNYNIGLFESDFCIMIPHRGILVIEVKSWIANNIIEVKDNSFLEYSTADEGIKHLRSPYKQAVGYTRELLKILREKITKDIFVLPVVWYTEITREQYYEKRLDILSDERVTLFREDLDLHNSSFNSKVRGLLDFAIEYYRKIPDNFDIDTMYQCRHIFETKEQIHKTYYKMGNNKGVRRRDNKKYYSIFKYIPNNDDANCYNETIDELLIHWSCGTKLYLLTNDIKFIGVLKDKLAKKMEDLNVDSKFGINTGSNGKDIRSYNMNCYNLDSNMANQIEIFDGDAAYLEKYKRELLYFDSNSGFNLNQYRIEHNDIARDIVVKAGAGTGKTHTMISRIMFLIHTLKLNAQSLAEEIAMITFTNEAADNMRSKIQEEIKNYYILTRDYNYFEMIATIKDIKISTIHSLSRKILQKYSDLIGYGYDLEITSGIMERRIQLQRTLDRIIKEDRKSNKYKLESILDEFDLNLYHFSRMIEVLMDKLEEKNIDVLRRDIDIDDSRHRTFSYLVKKIILDTEKNTRNSLKNRNSIRLSDIIIELDNLVNQMINRNIEAPKVKYLFIDEFQDTDNVQIDLVARFKELFKINLFIVGDVKQCIYRFRGAEENAFDRLVEDGELWDEYELNKNYRTDKHLLDTYNSIFEKWAKNNRLMYSSSRDRLISDIVLNNPKKDNFFKRVRINQSDDSQFQERLVDEIRQQYENLPQGGTVAILVRENREAQDVVDIGKKSGLNIEYKNAGGLYQAESTLDFYKLVLALQNNKSPKHLINLYDTNYICDSLDIKGVFMHRGKDRELYDYIMKNWPLENWEKYIENFKKYTALKVLREIVKELRPWDIYGEKYNDNTERRKMYYKRNLDLLFETFSIANKTDYLTLNKIENSLRINITTRQQEEAATMDLEEEGKNIICTTVHGAKGLEYHTVILPYTNKDVSGVRKGGRYNFLVINGEESQKVKIGYRIRGLNPGSVMKNSYFEIENIDDQEYRLKEETRILYVALTRAIKNLVIFEYDENKNKESWQNYLE